MLPSLAGDEDGAGGGGGVVAGAAHWSSDDSDADDAPAAAIPIAPWARGDDASAGVGAMTVAIPVASWAGAEDTGGGVATMTFVYGLPIGDPQAAARVRRLLRVSVGIAAAAVATEVIKFATLGTTGADISASTLFLGVLELVCVRRARDVCAWLRRQGRS